MNPDAPISYDPLGGPIRYTLEDIRDVNEAVNAADSELVESFGLRSVVLEPDPFLVAEAYRASFQKFITQLWTMLSLECPEDYETI